MSINYINQENKEAYKIGTVYKGNIKIGQIYKGNQLVYQSASKVTYIVDTNESYIEKVEPNKTILSPSTFVPEKEGWTFVGWSNTKNASSNILTSATTNEYTTLYAVFEQTVICKFTSNSTQTASGTRYYNNGNLVNATIIVPKGASKSGWTWRGWSAAGDTAADAAVKYSNGAKISNVEKEATYYGLYKKTTEKVTRWKCWWCGHEFSSKPSNCDLAGNTSHPSEPNIHPKTTKIIKHYRSGSGKEISY